MTREDAAFLEYLAEERAAREAYEAALFEPLAVARGTFGEQGLKTRQVIHSEYTYALNHGEGRVTDDEAYIASVRRVIDEAWKDVTESITRHMPDVILADRLCDRIRNLVAAERTLCDGKDGK